MPENVSFDRDLLFGLLAIDRGLITRDAFIAATNGWLIEGRRPIGTILVEQGSMEPALRDTFEAMLSRHVTEHGGDIVRCLQAQQGPLVEEIARSLALLNEPEIRRSLAHLKGVEATQVVQGEKDSGAMSDADPEVLSGDGPDRKRRTRPEPLWKAGRFGVIRRIGGDGMGIIYEAYDEMELGRRVAVKTVNEENLSSPWSLERYRKLLRKEGEINGNLEHPNIIPVYGLGTTETGKPFFAMRFVDQIDLRVAIRNFHNGRPLLHRERVVDPAEPASTVTPNLSAPTTVVVDASGKGSSAGKAPRADRTDEPPRIRFDRLDGQRNMDFREMLERFTDVCDAIDYAHSRSVLHRDLKPGNVMLGEHGETLVIDWGVAKIRNTADEGKPEPLEIPIDHEGPGPKTGKGKAVGTLGYMSPEQLMGANERLNDTTDIFSLGVILYEILTGHRPYSDRIHEELDRLTDSKDKALRLHAEIAKGVPDLLAENPTIPRPLAAICLKAIAFDQHQRYQSAKTLAEDVGKWLADEPIDVYQETFPERARRWVRKNRGASAAIAASLAFLAVGGVFYGAILNNYNAQLTVERDYARQSEAQANEQRKLAEQREAETNVAKANQRFGDLNNAVKLAMAGGAWNEAIRTLDELEKHIEDSGLPVTDEVRMDLRLDRMEALDGSNRNVEGLALIKSLEELSRTNPGKLTSRQRGRLLVRKGDLTIETLKPGDVSPYELALKEDLSPSQRSYVEALSEPDPEKAERLYEKALDENPYNLRAVVMVAMIKMLRGKSEEAIERLRISRSLMPGDGTLLFFEKALRVIVYKEKLSDDERKELEATFDRATVRVMIDSLDLIARGESVALPELIGLLRRLITAIGRGEDQSGIGSVDVLVTNPHAALLPLRDAVQSMINYPIHFAAQSQGGGIALKLAASRLRGMLKIPVKNREQRIEAYRNVLKNFPISFFAMALGLEHLEAGKIEQAAEAFANIPERDALHEDHRALMSATSNLALHFTEQILGRMRQNKPVLGPGGVMNAATARHVRKFVERILREQTPLTDYELALVAQLITYIEDPELGTLFFENQQRIETNPYNISLSRFFRALSNPYDAIEYMKSTSGGILGDTRSALWIRLHRDHPELAGAYPFLNEMPENPFMPTNLDHPLPVWFEVSSPTALRPAP